MDVLGLGKAAKSHAIAPCSWSTSNSISFTKVLLLNLIYFSVSAFSFGFM